MLQERTLTSDEVWDACSTRLKQYYARTLDTETVGTFTRSSPATVVRWLENQSTNGDRLIRLWYFLEAAGFSSPEIDDLNAYNRYVGQLFAFDVIDMPEVLKIINVKQESSAFEFMRGRTPMHPTLLLEDLEPRYGNELAGARRMLRAILQNIPSAPAAPTAWGYP